MEAFLKECKDKGIQVICKDGKNLSYKASKGPIDRNMLIFMKKLPIRTFCLKCRS